MTEDVVTTLDAFSETQSQEKAAQIRKANIRIR
jgi:hypothetical protein